ncbi:MAG: LTA synthase family protein [Atopobiaceae bacterium]|nr:LTA synthase family protein [Atopobiaceae bacterium]
MTTQHPSTGATRSWRPILWQWCLPIALAYLELAFKLSTTGSLWPAVVPILLFSASLGQLLQLCCALSDNPRANRIARLVVLLTLGVLFCVEYFVYRQFKLFYDPITVAAGAGGVVNQFGGEASALVLSPDGIVHLVAFLLPACLYAFFGIVRAMDPAERDDSTSRILRGCQVAGTHLAALFLVACLGPLGDVYATRYTFENGVPAFGLLTGLRKEAQEALLGTQGGFQVDEPSDGPSTRTPDSEDPSPDTAPVQADEEAEEPFVPEPATLDLDFDELAQNTDNATWAELDRYVASLEPSHTNAYTGLFKGYNLIFVSAEAFSAEAIRPDITPTLYSLWKYGIQLTDYYQFDTAGTTGGECANLFGLLATDGGSSVRETAGYNNYLTLGNLLNREGYNGWAFHNNTYTYYGRDTTHNNLGYNNGYMGYGNGMEQWVTWQWPQSDLEMMSATFDNLYGKSSPFNVYYMSVSGHSNYDPWDNAMSQKNWDRVADLPYSDRVKGYLAANVELDRAMEYLLKRLKQEHIYRKTVIVISADHFPYGLDDDGPIGQLPYLSELYGYDVTDVFQRDHNRPIIWCGSLPKRGLHLVVDSPTMSIDLLPTLCNLFGLPWDSRLLPGRDVLDPDTQGLAFNLNYDWRTSLGTYWGGSGTFVPVEGAQVPDGYVDAMNTTVANKIRYCDGVLSTDYYRHVFGDPQDVQAVHDAAASES